MSEHDGERELVLGNKQLLTIFFVAVLLCGVFFAMGYVVGGNSAKSSLTASTTDSSTAPVTEGKREQPTVPTDSGSATPTPQDNAGQLPAAESQMADNPAAAGPQPAAAPPAATPVPSPVTVAPAKAAEVAPAAGGMPVSTPESGASYMQVAATARPTAEDLVRTMREKKLPAILALSSKPALFRVLVGPYRSTYSLSQAKIELKSLGFQDPVLYKQP